MISLIIVGFGLILGVNSLYSRFCDVVKRPSQFSHGKTQAKASRVVAGRT